MVRERPGDHHLPQEEGRRVVGRPDEGQAVQALHQDRLRQVVRGGRPGVHGRDPRPERRHGRHGRHGRHARHDVILLYFIILTPLTL